MTLLQITARPEVEFVPESTHPYGPLNEAHTALAAVGLDWKVELHELTTVDEGLEVPRNRAVVRVAEGQAKRVLSVVGRDYTPVQNEAFAEFVFAATRYQGAAPPVFSSQFKDELIAGSIALHDVELGGMPVRQSLVLTNAHSSAYSFAAYVRLVTKDDGLDVDALGGSQHWDIKLRHRSQITAHLEDAVAVADRAATVTKAFLVKAEALEAIPATAEDIYAVAKVLAGPKAGPDGIDLVREGLERYLEAERQYAPDGVLSLCGLYLGALRADRGRARRTLRDPIRRADRAFVSNLAGEAAKRRLTIWTAVLRCAA